MTADGRLTVASFAALVALPPLLAVPTVFGHGVSMCRGSPHGPPAPSLVALHCQLTT